jgi:Ca2+-transporting ATPase
MKTNYPIKNPYAFSIEDLSKTLHTCIDHRLSMHEAHLRNSQFGLNRYQEQSQKSAWVIAWTQFQNPIVYILVFTIVISTLLGHYVEAIAIGVVIVINALIGFLMEMQARRSMNALKEMDIVTSNVIRDGKTHKINSEKLTPGDLITLQSGDIVPGDGRLLECNILQCDESSLTGESMPSHKSIEILDKETALGDRANMVFKGSSVMTGNAKALITSIAKETELGRITFLVDSSVDSATPLDKKLIALSKKLIWITIAMTSIFAITGIIQGKDLFLIVETSIALSVAAFPEGLPIVSTVALSYGMLLMARRNAIVKKLSAVETLGSTNVILTDKTGTLTENKIQMDTLCFPDEIVKVSIENNRLVFNDGEIQNKKNFEKLKLVGALCNNASIEKSNVIEKEVGDPIEIALIHMVNASGHPVIDIQKKYKRIGEVPFDADIKMMATLHNYDDIHLVCAKGSVEHLLEKCSYILVGEFVKKITKRDKKKILKQSEKLAEQGMRVLGFAYKEALDIPKENFLSDLVYTGSIGFLDPPRLDIKKAIITCRNAGIKVVMITGDHPKTALNIAKKIGLIDETDQNVIIGGELPKSESLTKDWKKKILSCAVFARTTPRQKLDIAVLFQKAGNIVAMTGDGVNDAPALKIADVGIAMGLRGTQVAKETANIVLKNDSFSSIAEAVGHGREIFNNIKKFVIYLVSCNLSEIFIVTSLGFLAPLSTLLPLQILFLNMVTDIFPALALGLGKGDKSVMKIPPRDPKEDIVTNKNWITIALYSFLITISVLVAVFYCREYISSDPKVINNLAFITLAFAQLFHVFNMASPQSKLFVNEITKNRFIWYAVAICSGLMILVHVIPQFRFVLGLSILPKRIWLVAILASLIPLFIIQMYKLCRKNK